MLIAKMPIEAFSRRACRESSRQQSRHNLIGVLRLASLAQDDTGWEGYDVIVPQCCCESTKITFACKNAPQQLLKRTPNSLPNSGIDRRIEQISEEIYHDVGQANRQDAALHEKVVPTADR